MSFSLNTISKNSVSTIRKQKSPRNHQQQSPINKYNPSPRTSAKSERLIQLSERTVFFSAADYLSVLAKQHHFHEQIQHHNGKEMVLTGTHTACITLGKRGGEVDPSLNLPVHKIGRGGLATWHGPGQLVVYPIIDIKQRRIGARNWVRLLEQITIDWLQCWGVSAIIRENCPGVWIDSPEGFSKIASIGLELKGGISTHGLSINLALPDSAFNGIAACGFANVRTTDLYSLRPQPLQIPTAEMAAHQLSARLWRALHRWPLSPRIR